MLIHIGWSRTATTWVQKGLFAHPDRGFSIVGKAHDQDHKTRKMVTHFSEHHPLKPLGPIRDKILDWLGPEIEAVQKAGKTPVITNEVLSGSEFASSYNAAKTADVLQAAFPDAKIFMATREQISMIFSHWIRYVFAGGILDIEDYIGWKYHPNWRELYPVFDLDSFCYNYTVSYYAELFGKDNVLLQPVELLRAHPQEYVQNIYNLCGLPAPEIPQSEFETEVNSNHDTLAVQYIRYMNMGLGHPLFGDSRLYNKIRENGRRLSKWYAQRRDPQCSKSIKDDKMRRIAQSVGDYYAEPNADLQDFVSCNLADFGYNVAKR
ncbi:MAG: sulfotransferase [Alphaproteobacteria bacterium]|nr:sulfotransferase [Alphaproteobacteria bacterium]